MNPQTIFVTRYVRSHEAALPFYEQLFGRPADNTPVDNCREWDFDGVLFQVIESPDAPGRTEFAFGVTDLGAEVARLRGAGADVGDPVAIEGFETLRYAEITDPEGVTTGFVEGY